jgi:DNA-binding transcriptional regulator YiaG
MTTDDAVAVAKLRRALRTGEAADIRKSADLSQAEVASVIGRTPACVCNWELGRRRPGGQAALRYGRLLEALSETRRMPAA